MKWVPAVLLLAACSSDSSTPAPDDAPPPQPGFVEAPHGSAPQVMSMGGAVLATPKVVPIFFGSDTTPVQADIEHFLDALATSDYWRQTTGEYGVGELAIAASVVTNAAVPKTDVQLAAWLAAQLDGTHPELGSPDASTIYAVFLPAGAVIEMDAGKSCQTFGAYHSETKNARGAITYAVMPRCAGLDSLTVTTSHELIEAATDPLPFTRGAWQAMDVAHAVWGITPGAEVADMCEYVAAATQATVGQFRVQRTWSNASAAAGHDPCVPVLAAPYQGAAPMLSDDVPIKDGEGRSVTTKGIAVPMGESRTIEVALFSDAPTADFPIHVVDAAQLHHQAAELTFALDRSTGHNGDTLKLTVTRTAPGQGGSEMLVVVGEQGASTALWWGLVGN